MRRRKKKLNLNDLKVVAMRWQGLNTQGRNQPIRDHKLKANQKRSYNRSLTNIVHKPHLIGCELETTTGHVNMPSRKYNTCQIIIQILSSHT